MTEEIVAGNVIQSELYGEITVEAKQIYQFEQGIVGFSHLNQFALLPYEETELYLLQSFSEEISLLLFPAMHCENNISFQIDDATVEKLGVKHQEELAVFYVLRFIDNQPFVNLRAPILIVPTTQKGCQYVVPDEKLSIREPLVVKGEEVC